MSVKGFQVDVSIAELNDVDTTGSPALATGDALIYDAGSGTFKQQPTPIFAGIGALPDVTITGSPAEVQEKNVLSYDNTTESWVNRTIPVAGIHATSTGLYSGGALSFGSGSPTTTTVTVAAGNGIVVDSYTDPLNPTFTTVSWSQFTDVTLTSLASADRTFLAINSVGALLQQTTDFTSAEHRDVIHIGTVGHANRTTVTAVRSNPHASFDAAVRLGDLAEAIGAFNISGNIYGPNATDLTVEKSAGQSYRLGNNFHVDKASPDITTDAAELGGISFNYSYRDGSGGYVLTDATTTIDPNNYDNAAGGSPPALTAIPTNDWQVQIIKHFPGGAGHRIEYGQTTYGTKAAAISAIPDINHVHNPAFAEGIIRGYLVVADAATNLSLTTQAQFIEAGRFGVSGAAGSSGSSIFSSAFESAELGIALNTNYSSAHGLGVVPKGMQAFIRCKTAEGGYAIGDEVEFMNVGAAGNSYKGIYANATNIGWHTGSVALRITNRTNGTAFAITLANWKIILRAYA